VGWGEEVSFILINNMYVYIGPICAVENATLFNRNLIIKNTVMVLNIGLIS